ncbi:anthranilate N-benzoyltransferase protein 2-like [Amaranthus tricolor]|uniref:anthranilate N-benzoyltransferase protein 2-like n=1 Tax=Amaranthus tricolor TaxID=29722 RepID=UPI00258E9B6A|nr:anthranilate N-benzoyltransferase protein 2-like [Amaranthus tricolor]
MSIEVKESMMVTPSKETPKGRLWLSKLDMIIRTPYSHTQVLFVYHHPNTKTNFFDTKTMKEALSEALVYFYPMAGRLTFNDENGRYEIDCNAEGAMFVVAEASQTLAEFGKDYSNPESQLGKLMFPSCDYSKGLSSFPLLLVQLTRFKCGSVCLGFAQHHHVADGVSHLHFIKSWGRLVRGLELDVVPVHDRLSYLAPRDPPKVTFHHLEYEPPLPPTSFSGPMGTPIEGTFKLTKSQVNALKEEAMKSVEKSTNYKLSTFVVQAAHIWRCATKARGLADDEDVKLLITVDGRSRLKTLPDGYCGNVYFLAACLDKAGNVSNNSLSYSAIKIYETLKRMNDTEYMKSAIDYVESYPDLKGLLRGPATTVCPNLRINSWVRLPTHEADFGWGKPNFVGAIGIKCEGQTKIMQNADEDGSVLVAIKLFPSHMELFKKYLYNF